MGHLSRGGGGGSSWASMALADHCDVLTQIHPLQYSQHIKTSIWSPFGNPSTLAFFAILCTLPTNQKYEKRKEKGERFFWDNYSELIVGPFNRNWGMRPMGQGRRKGLLRLKGWTFKENPSCCWGGVPSRQKGGRSSGHQEMRKECRARHAIIHILSYEGTPLTGKTPPSEQKTGFGILKQWFNKNPKGAPAP